MPGATRPTTWFGTLRRDGGLFALVAGLSLVMGLVYPLLSVPRSDAAEAGVICTHLGTKTLDAGNGKSAPATTGCPLCVAGHICAAPPLAPGAPGMPDATVLPVHAVAIAGTFPDRVPPGQRAGGEPPPAIRAPPVPA